jgi:hypothetical protein
VVWLSSDANGFNTGLCSICRAEEGLASGTDCVEARLGSHDVSPRTLHGKSPAITWPNSGVSRTPARQPVRRDSPLHEAMSWVATSPNGPQAKVKSAFSISSEN